MFPSPVPGPLSQPPPNALTIPGFALTAAPTRGTSPSSLLPLSALPSYPSPSYPSPTSSPFRLSVIHSEDWGGASHSANILLPPSPSSFSFASPSSHLAPSTPGWLGREGGWRSSDLGSLGVGRSGGGLGNLFGGGRANEPGLTLMGATGIGLGGVVGGGGKGPGRPKTANGPPSAVLNESEFPSLVSRPPPGVFPAPTGLPLHSHSPPGQLGMGGGMTGHFSHLLSNPLSSHPNSALPPPRNAYASFVKSNALESAPEFRIQNEDFPALPGATEGGAAQAATGATGASAGGGEATERRAVAPPGPKTGIQTGPDGRVTGIPPGMLCDQFGMAGLLTFLRAIESEPVIVALALGHDLTTLGLNLNAPEKNLYQSFGGPWSEWSVRPADIDFHVPEEYLTNVWIRDKLPPIKLNRFQDDTLFYLFYNFGGDFLQTAAAAELYSRDWRYHKEERVWLTRAPQCVPIEQTPSYERGAYNVFDPTHWRKVVKEMVLEYSKLEERPAVTQPPVSNPTAPQPSSQQLPNPHSTPNGESGSGSTGVGS